MDNNDMKSQAEKYREEMMKLYGRSTSKTDKTETAENDCKSEIDFTPEPMPVIIKDTTDEETPSVITPAYDGISEEISETDEKTEEYISEESDIIQKYPDPDIENILQPVTQFNDEDYNRRQKYDSIGWLSINVRTGGNSSPVANASAVITSMADGNLTFKASAVTDESGQIVKIPLPAPSPLLSLDSDNQIKPYSVYDIEIYADGFFRERSIDVPVFAGITSIQQFDMIPVPLYMSENSETISYYNQEPELQ